MSGAISGQHEWRLLADIDINVGAEGKAGIKVKAFNKLQQMVMQRLGIYQKVTYNNQECFVHRTSLKKFLDRNKDLLGNTEGKTDIEKFNMLVTRVGEHRDTRNKARIEKIKSLIEACKTPGMVVRISQKDLNFLIQKFLRTSIQGEIFKSLKKDFDKKNQEYFITAEQLSRAFGMDKPLFKAHMLALVNESTPVEYKDLGLSEESVTKQFDLRFSGKITESQTLSEKIEQIVVLNREMNKFVYSLSQEQQKELRKYLESKNPFTFQVHEKLGVTICEQALAGHTEKVFTKEECLQFLINL
jgi:HD superfamily phosphohydrolase